MIQCAYSKYYYDADGINLHSFICDEPKTSDSPFCMFHDPIFSKMNPKDVTSKFMQKLEKAKSSGFPLECVGYKLPLLVISNLIDIQINLTDAEIESIVFNKAIFSKSVNFNNVIFENAVIFQCIFQNKVSFRSTIFKQNVSFNGVIFDSADFTKTIFKGVVDFANTTFKNSSIFNTVFPDGTFFTESTFGDVNFNYSEFLGFVSFKKAKFEKKTDFSSCKFNGSSDFQFVTFQDANFFESTFNNVAYFINATFRRNVSFSSVTFGECIFRAIFYSQANFTTTVFGKATFYSSIFYDLTFFSFSHFKNQADFFRVEFHDLTHFSRVTFDKPERILFDSNLSKISFLSTDISRIVFGGNVSWADNSLIKIYEEDLLEEYFVKRKPTRIIGTFEVSLIKDTRLDNIVAIYRNLRENFEYNLKYEDAGRAFVREREITRHYKEHPSGSYNLIKHKNWLSRNFSFSAFYYYLARYGESYSIPFGWALLFIIGSTLYFWYVGVHNAVHPLTYDTLNIKDEFKRSLTDFVPALNMEYKHLSDYFLRIISLPILGSFFIALRRKLERRFRH